MDLGLEGRVALVAASSQGLGKAVASAFAHAGARVAMCARNAGELERAAGEIRDRTGAEVFATTTDVTDESAVRELTAAVRERWGRIDICVANAGGPPAKPFLETTTADWRRAVDANLMSVVWLAHAVLPGMRDQGWGRFAAITSVSVERAIDNLVLSNSVRCAVHGLVRTLAREFGTSGVLVNSVMPGYTATDRIRDLGIPEEQMAAGIPMRRLGRPEELADMVVFLCSERSSYVTGQAVAVDGGFIQG